MGRKRKELGPKPNRINWLKRNAIKQSNVEVLKKLYDKSN
jgi:hypothetical protein